MSRKVSTFAGIITAPLNTHNFIVSIPGLNNDAFNLVVEASTFPTYKFREVVLYTHGEPVSYPALPEGSRDWTVTVPESDSATMYKVLLALYKEMYDEQSGVLKIPKYRDIMVSSRDLNDDLVFSVILHGAWFRGIDPVQLQNTDPTQVWKWPVTFTFSWIENLDPHKNTGTKNPFGS